MKDKIMASATMTDMEKLQKIFDIDKENLKKQFPELYYTILAVLDNEKKNRCKNSANALNF